MMRGIEVGQIRTTVNIKGIYAADIGSTKWWAKVYSILFLPSFIYHATHKSIKKQSILWDYIEHLSLTLHQGKRSVTLLHTFNFIETMILNRSYKGMSEGYQACAKEKNEHWLFHRIWRMETTESVVLYPERRHFILQLSWWISAKERWKPYILLSISLVVESYSKVVIHITYKFILLCLYLTYFKVSKIKSH